MKENRWTFTQHPWRLSNPYCHISLLEVDFVNPAPEPEPLLDILRETGINASLHLTLHHNLMESGAPTLLSCSYATLEEQTV
jgi:hypothetical protein